MNWIIDLIIFLYTYTLGLLPALEDDSPYVVAFEGASDGIGNVIYIATQTPIVRVFAEFLFFALAIIITIYTYKAERGFITL